MLSCIFNQEILPKIEKEIDFLDSNLSVDYSDFVYVDGEEGDYGKIRYYKDGELIATKVVLGGDDELIEMTPEGKEFLIESLKEIIASSIYLATVNK